MLCVAYINIECNASSGVKGTGRLLGVSNDCFMFCPDFSSLFNEHAIFEAVRIPDLYKLLLVATYKYPQVDF